MAENLGERKFGFIDLAVARTWFKRSVSWIIIVLVIVGILARG